MQARLLDLEVTSGSSVRVSLHPERAPEAVDARSDTTLNVVISLAAFDTVKRVGAAYEEVADSVTPSEPMTAPEATAGDDSVQEGQG